MQQAVEAKTGRLFRQPTLQYRLLGATRTCVGGQAAGGQAAEEAVSCPQVCSREAPPDTCKPGHQCPSPSRASSTQSARKSWGPAGNRGGEGGGGGGGGGGEEVQGLFAGWLTPHWGEQRSVERCLPRGEGCVVRQAAPPALPGAALACNAGTCAGSCPGGQSVGLPARRATDAGGLSEPRALSGAGRRCHPCATLPGV